MNGQKSVILITGTSNAAELQALNTVGDCADWSHISNYLSSNSLPLSPEGISFLFFYIFQNEDHFIQLDKLDELDRITQA